MCRRTTEHYLLFNAVRELFDDRVGQHFGGDLLDQRFDGGGIQAVGQRDREIFALPDRGYVAVSDLVQGVLDGLALGVQDRSLQRDIDMRLHHP